MDPELLRLASSIKKNTPTEGAVMPKGYSGIFDRKAPGGGAPRPDGALDGPSGHHASNHGGVGGAHRPPQPAATPSGGGHSAAPSEGGPKQAPRYTMIFKDVRDGANVPSFPVPIAQPKPTTPVKKKAEPVGGCSCSIM
eukprot:TRINITY_DN1052_c0_g1_i1.p2 TRINITY_DN1052_c0_g1~~TRINITY_DN1052_c0_g1_i1.p2  ORF type:complete len:139 (-),score=14.97 TRINITY_DN1052_c0_g1_i1:1126-1542(-)